MASFQGEQVTQTKCPLEKKQKQEDILHKSSQIFSICTMIIFSRPRKNGHVVRQVQVDLGDKRTHYLKSELS